MATKNETGIQPLEDRVLIREIEKEDTERTTDSGIIIPEAVEEDKGANRGEVVAVGEGKIDEDGERQPMPVSPGDKVLFSWGDQLTIDGKDYHIVTASNILATIK